MRPKFAIACAAAVLFASVFADAGARSSPHRHRKRPPAAQPPAGGRGRGTFPNTQRALADPAIIQRGNALYGINCRLCHGADLRGGDMGGINLLRSQLVLSDQNGELILPVVTEGRQRPGMPPMPPLPLPDDDIKAIAAYIHSVDGDDRPARAGRRRVRRSC